MRHFQLDVFLKKITDPDVGWMAMGARYLLRNKGIGDKTTFVVFRDATEARTLLAARVVKFHTGASGFRF